MKPLTRSKLVPVWPCLYSSHGLSHPRQSRGTDESFKTGVWQQLDDFANKFIMVFWIFIMVTLVLRGSVWCAITLIPITKPATSNSMLFVFQFSLCLWCSEYCWSLQQQSMPVQGATANPCLHSNLANSGKFTHLLTFCRTVCYTKASAEFVLAIVNT